MINAREQRRQRLFQIVEIGVANDFASRAYDFLYVFLVLLNLLVSVFMTYDSMQAQYGSLFKTVESVTVVYFTVDYILRMWTAKYLHPKLTARKSTIKYAFSFGGIVDLLSFLPYYLPVFFPAGMAVFRVLRVVRIFRLFRVNAYYDSLSVITEVISSKRQQLISSVFILLVLMLASSLCMYSLEHEAQPEVFSNAFSGIWWSVSTLLTIGYGDIYPITTMGQLFSIVITFLGVGMVAIPTGIISAGFVDQYSRIKRMNEYASESDVHFIKVHLTEQDAWTGTAIRQMGLPRGIIVAAIQRGDEIIVPRGSVTLMANDTVVLGAESFADGEKRIDLKEIVLREQHPWNGQRIRDLDISRQTIIVMVKRKSAILIPSGNMVLTTGDRVIIYTQHKMAEASEFFI